VDARSAMLCQTGQSSQVRDFDCAPGWLDPAASCKFLQLAADHLAGATEFVGEILMSGGDTMFVTRELQQLMRQPDIDSFKSDFLDDPEQVRHTAAKGGEYELAKFPGGRDQIIKQDTSYRNGANPRFSNSLRPVFLVAHQACGGQGATFARLDAIQHDFPTRLGRLLNANRSLQEQQEMLRRLPRPKYSAALGEFDDQTSIAQPPGNVRWQLP